MSSAITEIRLPVRVLPASAPRTTKTGKTLWMQDVQFDQANSRSVSKQRVYFEESRILPAGDYTAAITVYEISRPDAKGYIQKDLALAFRDLQPAK